VVSLFDTVRLVSGETATIVEILGNEDSFVADIEKESGTDTEFVYPSQIKEVLTKH